MLSIATIKISRREEKSQYFHVVVLEYLEKMVIIKSEICVLVQSKKISITKIYQR